MYNQCQRPVCLAGQVTALLKIDFRSSQSHTSAPNIILKETCFDQRRFCTHQTANTLVVPNWKAAEDKTNQTFVYEMAWKAERKTNQIFVYEIF